MLRAGEQKLTFRLDGFIFYFREGGVRGVSFVASPLLAGSPVVGSRWRGLVAQPDVFFTLAHLGGVTDAALAASGPLPPDGMDMWDGLRTGGDSPRNEVVHNINGGFAGAITVGDWKLLKGYPNQAGRGFDGWTKPPEANTSTTTQKGCAGSDCPCAGRPCLFNITADPEERNDLAIAMPDVVQQLMRRYTELQRSEVTIEQSGLCPETKLPDGSIYNRGGLPDASAPDGCLANNAAGHWQPWLP